MVQLVLMDQQLVQRVLEAMLLDTGCLVMVVTDPVALVVLAVAVAAAAALVSTQAVTHRAVALRMEPVPVEPVVVAVARVVPVVSVEPAAEQLMEFLFSIMVQMVTW